MKTNLLFAFIVVACIPALSSAQCTSQNKNLPEHTEYTDAHMRAPTGTCETFTCTVAQTKLALQCKLLADQLCPPAQCTQGVAKVTGGSCALSGTRINTIYDDGMANGEMCKVIASGAVCSIACSPKKSKLQELIDYIHSLGPRTVQ